MQISAKAPEETINVLGDGTGWLHRQAKTAAEKRRAWGWQALRTAIVCVLLFAGSALTISWFHTDVNMQDAQAALFRFAAAKPENSAPNTAHAVFTTAPTGRFSPYPRRIRAASPSKAKPRPA